MDDDEFPKQAGQDFSNNFRRAWTSGLGILLGREGETWHGNR